MSVKLPSASATKDGIVENATQTFAGAKTWNDIQTWMAAAGTVTAGTYSAAGAWTIGPAVTGNYTGQQHTISGGLTAGNVTSTGNSGRFAIGTNVRLTSQNAEQMRSNATTGGTGFLLYNDTIATNPALDFYYNAPGESTGTPATLAGRYTFQGMWTIGPATVTAAIGHSLNGYLKMEGNSSSPGPSYFGRSATNYSALTFNAAPSTTTLQYARQVIDTATIVSLGRATAAAGTYLEVHGFASGAAGNVTLSSTSLVAAFTQTGLVLSKQLTVGVTTDSSTGTQTFDPYTLLTGNVLYFNGAATVTLRGITLPTAQDGTMVWIFNNTGTTLTIKNAFNNNSNDFANSSGADVSLTNGQNVAYMYVGSRWRGIRAT